MSSALHARPPHALLWLAVLVAAFACDAESAESRARSYALDYHATFEPAHGYAAVEIRVAQGAGELRTLDFRAPKPRYANAAGDGTVERAGDRLVWTVPPTGGTLRYTAAIDHKRAGAFDARLTEDWALFRLDDLFPPAKVRSLRGAQSRATLSFAGPEGWTFETRYGPSNARVEIANDERRFDRPTGWAIAGKLGIRRAEIEGRRVAVAAPVGEEFRRMDTLAFLRWTLPEFTKAFPDFPERLLIVGADGEFWRGALSGPSSLYLHGDRPLISENGTSTLLHELAHVAMATPPAPGDDWIVEGLAEFYSLEILARTGGISHRRRESSLESLNRWSEEDEAVLADPSTGSATARAAAMFHELDDELVDAGHSMDDLMVRLFDGGSVDRARLRQIAEELLGGSSKALDSALADVRER